MTTFHRFLSNSALVLLTAMVASATGRAAPRPNVLLIMPDDLSYDDFSFSNAQGPRTPNIDRLARGSVQLTDFHVSPTCSPTRAALMTGRYNDATGVWHTIKGRELLRADEITMADVFRANGYRTALIGKWHLGDSYPFRPEDRGFDTVAMIHGGGIDQQPDFWGNTNLPPSTLFVNDRPVPLAAQAAGVPGAYSTNFFTERAIDFIKDCTAHAAPFFLYLPYNVAHVPLDMPPDARPGIDAHMATVENLDKNVGRLLDYLRQSHLEEGTILVFLTDNGMASALWRGGKSNEYEGGHRVPCFIRWKDGGLGGGESEEREMPRLASHIDWLPTLMDLIGLHDVADRPPQVPIQGKSLRTLFGGEPATEDQSLWNRILVVDNQRSDHLQEYKQSCVMQDETDSRGRILHQWRLIPESATEGKLYDLLSDPKEATDASGVPGRAGLIAALQAAYGAWWQEVSARGGEYSRVVLGTQAEPRICLYAHDWHNDDSAGDAGVPWNQGMVAAGLKLNGFNAVRFARPGTWRFDLRRWPAEIAGETTLTSALRTPLVHGFRNGDKPTKGVTLPIHSARIRIWKGETTYADLREDADPQASGAVFLVSHLPAGPALIQTWFYDAAGAELGGAYYDYVEFQPPAGTAAAPVPAYLSGYESLYARSPRQAAKKWFADARYGLMVHYCLASVLDRGKAAYLSRPSQSADRSLFARFTATEFDAGRIADLAVAAGMKYVNLTTRHLGGIPGRPPTE